MLAFGEEDFDIQQVAPSGIWVSRILSQHQFDLFRAAINLRNGKHYDLLLVVGEDFHASQVRDTIYWLMALSDHPSWTLALPRFGVCRPDLGVMSVAYVSDLTVWEKITSMPESRPFSLCAEATRLASLVRARDGCIFHRLALPDPLDREVFSRMVFPRALTVPGLEVLAVGTSEQKQVIVRTEITDARGGRHAVRELIAPAQIGHLYRLFRESNYPKVISEREQHLIMMDEAEQVLGGLNYVLQDKDIVYLSGMVVAAPLEGRGITGVLLEDFLIRMAARGIRVVKTDFFLRRFYTAHGFQVDPRWGGLVRRLAPD